MENKDVKITISLCKDYLCLKVKNANSVFWKDVKINKENFKDTPDLCFWWLLNSLKPVFHSMPHDSIETKFYVKSIDDFEKLLDEKISFVSVILKNTNNMIKDCFEYKGIARENNGILFINSDSERRYIGFYNKMLDDKSQEINYLNMKSGFNAEKREWGKSDIPIDINELINIIKEKKIRKIVSINVLLLSIYIINTGIFLNAVFSFIGIEHIIIDNDPYDLKPEGYLKMLFSNSESVPRFNCPYIFTKPWLKKYALTNIQRVPIPQYYKLHTDLPELPEDYSLLVLSNSRIENVRQMYFSIVFLLDHINEDFLYRDIQLWFLAMQYIITEVMDMNEFDRLKYNSNLHTFFYTVVQLLKYEVIEAIDTPRNIEIYGDRGWKILFPEYYRGMLNQREIEDKLSMNRYLCLLLNSSLTYFQASAPVYDAAALNVPFINMAALCKSNALQGLEKIEYSNNRELNALISDTSFLKNSDFRDSLKKYKRALIESTEFMHNKIIDFKYDGCNTFYHKELLEHDKLLDEMVFSYIDEKESFLRDCFDILFLGKSIDYDITKSLYFNRNYSLRIMNM